MATFREGQEVEVYAVTQEAYAGFAARRRWRKAIIMNAEGIYNEPRSYRAKFPDGARAVFDAEHIRAIELIHTKGPLIDMGDNLGMRIHTFEGNREP